MRVPFFLRLSLVLCGLLVSAPFLNPFHSFPQVSFYTEWLAFVIGLAALAATAVVRSSNAVPIPGMCLGLFLLTALLVLQAALGQVAYPLRSAMGALYLIWAALLVMLGAWLKSELGEAAVSRALQWWLALAGLVAATSGFIQYYHVRLPVGVYASVQPFNAMFGTVNQPNNFADYLGCALVSAAFLHARNALRLFPALCIALPLAAGMALSGSRASWGYMVIVAALVALVRLGGHSQEAKRLLQLGSFAFAVFLLVQVLNFYTGIFEGPEGRPISSGERLIRYLEIGVGIGERPIRVQLFQYAWLMLLSNPLLGVGFGEYAWRALELSADLPGGVPPGLDRHSHNLFLQLLAETGIAGCLCFLVPLASWLWRTPWRNLNPERCWAIGVLAVIGFHSMVEFPLWHANFLGAFALVFGAASPGGTAMEPTRARRGLILVVVLAGIFTARSAWSDYRAFERWYLAVEAKGARGEIPGKSDLERLMELREDSLFGPYFERIASEAIALDEDGLGDKLALNTQVMHAYPMPSVVLRQVVLLALYGSDTEAVRLLRAAIRVYPQWTRQWLPTLEKLARDRPAAFAALLGLARSGLGEGGP
jgi:O-antigen ligase